MRLWTPGSIDEAIAGVRERGLRCRLECRQRYSAIRDSGNQRHDVPIDNSGRVPDPESGLAIAPSKPAPGRHDAIDAQIRDEIAVMQGVMIPDLRQNEHLVRFDAKEIRRGIEVRIGETGVHAIAVVECAFDIGRNLGL